MAQVAETTIARQELRTMVDCIPDDDVATAHKFLRSLIDPFELALLMAEPDDEPLTGYEIAATEAAVQRELRGEPLIPHEDVLREFGLLDGA